MEGKAELNYTWNSKIDTTPEMKTTPKLKRTPKIKTTPQKRQPQNVDILKNENDFVGEL